MRHGDPGTALALPTRAGAEAVLFQDCRGGDAVMPPLVERAGSVAQRTGERAMNRLFAAGGSGPRRATTRGLLPIALLLVGVVGGEVRAQAAPEASAPPPIAASFSGERLGFDVSFLFFRRAAVSRLTLEPGPVGAPAAHLSGSATSADAGHYVARASIETKGFVGWLNTRRHVYTSHLVPCEGGLRWCSRRFVMDLTERGHREVRTTSVDPARGSVTWTVERAGVVVETGGEPLRPDHRYDDMLAALYNFRAGVYGPVERGGRYEVQTLPVKGVRSFTIRVLDGDAEAGARRKFELGKGGFVIAARVPQEIFGREGEVLAWLSPDLVPLGGSVERYVGFGDVHGRLVEVVRAAGR
jgi:hypothetical protein